MTIIVFLGLSVLDLASIYAVVKVRGARGSHPLLPFEPPLQ